ncbi:MAG TPA: radical SAM protein [Terriglobales bacterium]|nr:radical SAM protein [Terriglobales bacterium]
MPDLFPDASSQQKFVGIARLAAEGQALSEGHDVEYLTIENRSILTRCLSPRMPFTWMINPYRGCEFACKYCYARYTHEFMELRDGLDFERKIYVKQHSAWLLRQELKNVAADESIAIGTATDPYQPAERKFEITRSLMEEFTRHSGLKISIVSKSDLILRDLELLRTVAGRNQLTVCITVTTMNTDLARILEPRAPRPDLRMRAVRKLVNAGVRAGVNCAPVLPGITDSPKDLDILVRAAAEAGAAFVFTNTLFLKPCAEKIFMPFLEEKFPKLVSLYRERYSRSSYLPEQYQRRIEQLVRRYCDKYGIRSRRTDPAPSALAQMSTPEQISLFASGQYQPKHGRMRAPTQSASNTVTNIRKTG